MKERLTIIIVSILIILSPVCLAAWISADNGGKIHASDIDDYQLPGKGTGDTILLPDDKLAEPPATAEEVYTLLSADAGTPSFMDGSFVTWLGETADGDVYRRFMNKSPDADLSGSRFWYELCGMTLNVLKDLYSGTAVLSGSSPGASVTIALTGDVCLADDWETMIVYEKKGGMLSECITGGLLERMNAADLTLINNEFTFSDRGEPLENKYYTFRSSPSNVSLLAEMGVDIVSLANNHVYDYGAEAFGDTLETLEGAGVEYMGAGRNIADASSPRYYIINGIKIAFVAATRAEKMPFTPEAGEYKSGVLRTYKSDRFTAVIAEAKANADYVIAYPHWGTENTTVLEKAQTDQARQYIDAGADAVVGSHPHCLQGIEFYKGCPIMYSLGNFWFNHEDGETALLEITVDVSSLSMSLVPCLQVGGVTSSAVGTEEGARILEYIESISPGVKINEDGKVTAEINQ
ncbi:MAG: CapA family protein [Eubacteriales bacterium]